MPSPIRSRQHSSTADAAKFIVVCLVALLTIFGMSTRALPQTFIPANAVGSVPLDLPQLTLAATPLSGGEIFGDITGVGSWRNLPMAPKTDGYVMSLKDTELPPWVNPVPEFFQSGADLYFWTWTGCFAMLFAFIMWWQTKDWWTRRWTLESINKLKIKLITQEATATKVDRYLLGTKFIEIGDFPAAIAELEDVEHEWSELRYHLDPEDAMGALATRAKLHNSKGYALLKLEPPRPAAARREFVRAITFWPEYPDALLNIAMELLKRKRYDVALRTADTAMKWQPAHPLLQEIQEHARQGMEIKAHMEAKQAEERPPKQLPGGEFAKIAAE